MHWATTLAVFFTVWWTVLFAVLPWGARPAQAPEEGHAPSAPARPNLKLKFAATTVVAALITAGIWLVADSGLVSFRDMAREGPPFATEVR